MGGGGWGGENKVILGGRGRGERERGGRERRIPQSRDPQSGAPWGGACLEETGSIW